MMKITGAGLDLIMALIHQPVYESFMF